MTVLRIVRIVKSGTAGLAHILKNKGGKMCIEVIKALYEYLEWRIKDHKADKYNELERIREFLRLYEDGLGWQTIKDHLEKGCHCEELKEINLLPGG